MNSPTEPYVFYTEPSELPIESHEVLTEPDELPIEHLCVPM